MKKFMMIISVVFCLCLKPGEAKAQIMTYDATNFFQALLSYLQDGDQMAENTAQFLQNLGIMEEQLDNLKKWNDRYSKISSGLYKGLAVSRIANNYESTYHMFQNYVSGLKAMEGQSISYYQARTAVNQGFQYLLLASREVKKAREYLDVTNNISEENRRRGLEECDKQLARINSSMNGHVSETLKEIDRARIINASIASVESAITIAK